MIWVEATPLCGQRIRPFVDGLKYVVMIWVEATPLGGRSKNPLILCCFAKYFSILWGGMAVYDTL